MSGDRRGARAEARVAAAAAEYAALLRVGLTRCAGGVWGLFGQNEPLPRIGRSAEVVALFELAAEIDAARAGLGLEPFELHARFVGLRGRGDSHQPGEPKLAAALLAELG